MTMTETRAKYTDAEVEAMGAKGHAFRNPDGHFSFPVGDAEDLDNAIKAVGRGGADHDAIRKYIIGRAKALGLSSQIPVTWNADGSAGGQSSAQRDPGWEQRRKRWAGSLIRKPARRSMVMEMRAMPDGTGGTNFEFEGYGAVFDAPFRMFDPWGDEYREVVRPGAFTRTLGNPDLYVPFLIGHNDQGIPLAQTANRTMTLSQDSRGLHVLAQMDGRRSDVRNLAYAVERGDMDQMSIGFVTMEQDWSPDWEQRSMLDLEMHQGDVSSVAVAANPATAGASMTALPAEILSRSGDGEELMMKGTRLRLPMIDAALDQAQAIFSKADLSALPPDIGQAIALVGSAGIHVDHVLKHEGLPDPDKGASSDWSADDPAAEERAARGEINDNSNQPDFNLPPPRPSGAAPYDAGAHSWKPSASCPSDSCPVYSQGDGARAQNEMDAVRCDQCGGPLYGEDGRLVVDDSGVVEEVGGALADADLLSRRLRLLELA